MPGICNNVYVVEIGMNGYTRMPGRYVRAEVQDNDSKPFNKAMQKLTVKLRLSFGESGWLKWWI